MNRKQVILLIVAGVVIGGLGFYFNQNRTKSWEN